MNRLVRVAAFALFFVSCTRFAVAAEPPRVTATVESTLITAKDQIRQFAFDGNQNSYFLSDGNPTTRDSFTLTFDKPVAVKSLAVVTGSSSQAQKLDGLDAGIVEGSIDGKAFTELAKFTGGEAKAQPKGQKFLALRIRPTADQKHPLAIREITLDSDPAVEVFKYPIEFTVDTADAPELKEWAEKTARVCEREYFMINEELKSPGFKPATQVSMTLKNDYNGVAETGGQRIKGSVKFYKAHPDDIGSMVHETVHVVQAYRGRGNPGWLVEGVADYIRFFKYEPGKIGRINADRAKYDGSYRVSASFLNFLCEKYDKEIVSKLNQAMREGKYKDDLFKEYTKKPLDELNDEWKLTLKK